MQPVPNSRLYNSVLQTSTLFWFSAELKFAAQVFAGDAEREGRQDDEYCCHKQPVEEYVQVRAVPVWTGERQNN